MEPNTPDDPAARFRKPQEQAQPQTSSSSGYGLTGMIEDTLTAPLGLGAVFTKLSQAPAPGFGVMVANVGAYSAAFMAVNVLRYKLTFPEVPAFFTPDKIALMAVVAFILLLLLSFAGAGVLHLAVQAAGGKGGYARSYQIYSLLSLFWPAVAASLSFPFAWLAVAAYWTYLAISAAESLQEVPAPQGRLVLTSLALAMGAAAWYVSVEADRYLTPYVQAARAAAQMTREVRDAQAAMAFQQSLQTAPAAGALSSTGAPAGSPDPMTQAQQLMLQAQQMMSQSGGPVIVPSGGGSGLQVLPPAGTMGSAPTTAHSIEQLKQTTEAMRQTELNTLNQLMPMVNNPAMTKNLPPQQAQQMQQIAGILSQLQDNLKTGKPMTPAQIAQLQQMAKESMQNAQKMKSPAQPPTQPAPQGSQP